MVLEHVVIHNWQKEEKEGCLFIQKKKKKQPTKKKKKKKQKKNQLEA